MPERIEATRKIIRYWHYISGGCLGTGAGYSGAFAFLSPDDTERVYRAPDTALAGFQRLDPAAAQAVWLAGYECITDHATTPITAFPCLDFGLADRNIGSGGDGYAEEMFPAVIAPTHADGTESVTGADLVTRIAGFVSSSLTAERSSDVPAVTVGSTDAGHVALDASASGRVASVADCYVSITGQVFLPFGGGTFEVTPGVPAVETHLTRPGQRANLLDASGNGSDLDLAFVGGGTAGNDLRMPGNDRVRISWADRTAVPGEGIREACVRDRCATTSRCAAKLSAG